MKPTLMKQAAPWRARAMAALIWASAWSCGTAVAVQPAPAEKFQMPELTVRDQGGAASMLSALRVPGVRQVILIVDAALPSAHRALDALNAKDIVGALPVLVLVSGSESELQSLKRGRDVSTQWRWLRIASRDELRRAGLRGLPILIGAEGDGSVGFAYFGLPPSSDRFSQLVQDWMRAATMPQSEAQQ